MKRAPGSEGVFDERLADTGAQLKEAEALLNQLARLATAAV
jgi:hypothetical protein